MIYFLLGIFVGAFIGVATMAVLLMASDDD
jgi:hypothetical protein